VLSIRQQTVTLKHGRVGVIADTHGLMRPEALAALKGSELIIHAGDIGKSEVLDSLNRIAPVLAIRGNNDRDPWAKAMADVLNVQVNGVKFQVIHNVHEIEDDPAERKIAVVISGHSHQPSVVKRDEILFVNPGSAGPRRFKLPVSVARINFAEKHIRAAIVELKFYRKLY
jgi:putative phosphoesterase